MYFSCFQNDRFSNHEIRPKDLLLKQIPSGISGSQDLILESYLNSREIVTNGVDLDINVHAIKNMLMATRVPESCV